MTPFPLTGPKNAQSVRPRLIAPKGRWPPTDVHREQQGTSEHVLNRR